MMKKNPTTYQAVPENQNGMLPIRKVVLYKHGIGYFERAGSIDGDTSVDLYFKAAEMNDVLKSLTTLDLADGLIASISYESTKPIEKQLEDISIRLTDENSLTDLLAQVKGARVVVNLGTKKVEGTIIGIEAATRNDGDVTITSNRLVLLVDGEALQSYDLLDISSTVFLDESLRKDLQHLLNTLISAKKKDRKKLTIFAKGSGKRDIHASYVVETPIWKTSYRVLLGKDKPIIQGWALVDNTQDEDWKNVALTLVAGLPVSFIYDLYSPRYKRRPIVHIQEEEAYAPPILEQAEEGFFDEQSSAGGMILSESAAPAAAPSLSRKRLAKTAATRSVAAKPEPVQTRTVDVGDLFHYEIENPITVKRGQSALVPILQTTFDGKRVAIYNSEIREKNPMSAILFKNITGMTLEGGPMTILEEDNYVGESLLDTIKPEEERIVPYSVELGCIISIDYSKNYTAYHLSRILRGTLHLYRYVIQKRTYIINNKSDKKIDLFLEHRFNQGWELVETIMPVERTENFYRFRMEIPAKQTTKFTVKEKGDTSETFSIQNVNRETIRLWLESKYISPDVSDNLHELSELNEEVEKLNRRIEAIETEIKTVFQDQERLRNNLQSLGSSENERGLRERYVSEMSKDEDKLRDNRSEMRKLKIEKEKVEKNLRDRIEALQFEHKI